MNLILDGGKSVSRVASVSQEPSPSFPVVAEIPVSNVKLHKIATGDCCTLAHPGEPFAIRFLLKNSFKASKSNFVVNNFLIQVVAVGKDNTMKEEQIATRTKVQMVPIAEQKGDEVKFDVKDEKKELW